MLIIDDFLRDFESFRNFCDTAKFVDEVNPVDGVIYPLICKEIPEDVRQEVFEALCELKGAPIVRPTLFLRLSPAGVPCPHKVHSDASMGAHSLMLYLSRAEDCRGGTSLVSHRETGIGYAPVSQAFADIVVTDQNTDDAWEIRQLAQMKPNRAVVFDAATLHRAEPVGGFGTAPADARLVLTCFFS